ncbi:activity-regulated cytoskeleton-associated protein-like [Clarias gariepinus]|uniref:activity-regulated cytoskeleton-associated protein-like n=1 Tax=Clarias gariepinus TaxID=13013 RepID=UPI00234C8E81|nr:activity-regulated cytoskeleton-associated protein-like [Clarias gariepinus]
MQTELNQCKVDVVALSEKVGTLEQDLRDSINSTINRKTSFRQAVDPGLAELERYCHEAIEKLERAVTDCFLRHDVVWDRQMKMLRLTSTPTIHRLQAYTPASSHSPALHTPSTPITTVTERVQHQRSHITYDIPPGVPAPSSSQLSSSVSPTMSSFYARPPIRLEFPSFGDASETADVLNFIEQCENYLEIRPLPSPELIGTLSTVLRGPALSWWKAEKGKVKDWNSFKQPFLAAFLLDDYLTEVEDKLRSLVQQPDQRLRDFAYDYRALCLKWKSDISEQELVSRVLKNMNPRVAGCLRGTVNTMEQLVKVGSMVEKDCMGAKDYWKKVESQHSKEKNKKQATERPPSKHLAGLSIAQP